MGARAKRVIRADAVRRDLFEAKVQRGEGCWEWQASTDNGYGRFKVGRHMEQAHRVAMALEDEEVSPEVQVLHRCDNRGCVRPSHLFYGTDADNMRDMVQKGRRDYASTPPPPSGPGERNGRARLISSQVLKIRQDPRKHGEIAEEYGVSRSTVSMIKRRENWRHL